MVRFGFGVSTILLSILGFLWLQNSGESIPEANQFGLEERWENTNLKTEDISNLFLNKYCQLNKKSFVACMNALSQLAEKESLSITEEGSLKPLGQMIPETEKERLLYWDQLYDQTKGRVFNVEKIWSSLKIKIKGQTREPLRVAQAFNSYLSVLKDPHTYILPKEYYEKVIAQSQNQMTSYGFIVNKINRKFIFTRVYPGSVFDKKGVSRGDQLLEVDGKDVSSFSEEELFNLFKNKRKNDFLVLQKEKMLKFTLAKENQTIKSVQLKKLLSENNKVQFQISIFKIADGVCKETEDYLTQAVMQKSSGVILDLRDNSGGSMDEVLCLAGLFVGNRKIYDLEYFDTPTERGLQAVAATKLMVNSQEETSKAEEFFSGKEQVYFGPLAVVINQGTASSAEILAGVIQDYQRGVIVGERSFGKGTFQEGEVWVKNSKILIFQTKGLFTLPSGRSPQLLGILPDVPLDEKEVAQSKELALLKEQGREEDIYYNPIRNPLAWHTQVAGYVNINNEPEKILENSTSLAPKKVQFKPKCKVDFNEVQTDDPALGKAQAQLVCSS